MLKTTVHTPPANGYCERFIGTTRRECLDWMIPLHERHLWRVLAEWIPHYNGERPHSALGPGLPDQPPGRATLTGHQPVTCASRRCQCSAWRSITTITAWKPSPREFLRSTGSGRSLCTCAPFRAQVEHGHEAYRPKRRALDLQGRGRKPRLGSPLPSRYTGIPKRKGGPSETR